MMRNRLNLPIDAVLDNRDSLRREPLGQGRMRTGQIVETLADKRTHLGFESFFADQTVKAIFRKLQDLGEGFLANGVAKPALEKFVNLAIDKVLDGFSRLLALQNACDVFRQAQLQRSDRIQHRRARSR